MIELACETDFVAKNDKFIALGRQRRCSALADSGAETRRCRARRRARTAAPSAASSKTRPPMLGEKVELRRIVRLAGDKFAVYLHRTNKDLPPQVGVVVAYTGDDAETARSIAQHISFADPQYLTRDEVPAADVENERRIVERDQPRRGQAGGRAARRSSRVASARSSSRSPCSSRTTRATTSSSCRTC